MINRTIFKIFKGGSRTYYYSSMFFPSKVKRDVFKLYAFVRKADDFVDSVPQEIEEFYKFCGKYRKALKGEKSGDVVIDSFVELSKRKGFKEEWGEAFLSAMEKDITKNKYSTIEETLEYIYGSAEVIGLFMAEIIGLDEKAYRTAMMLGRAMQYINFIRDINEDVTLGRQYFPLTEMKKYGLSSLSEEENRKNPDAFKKFVRAQLDSYCKWQEEGVKGYNYIPFRCLVPIKTASDMYKWTGQQIYNDPFVVYTIKVKPKIGKILRAYLKNIFFFFKTDDACKAQFKPVSDR